MCHASNFSRDVPGLSCKAQGLFLCLEMGWLGSHKRALAAITKGASN